MYSIHRQSIMEPYLCDDQKINANRTHSRKMSYVGESKQLQVEIHVPPPELRAHPSSSTSQPRLSLESSPDSVLYTHGTQDSYSSGYSGMSESYSSAGGVGVYEEHVPGNLSGYLNDYSDVGSCIQRITRQRIRPTDEEPAVTTTTDNETSFSTVTQAPSSLLESDDFIYLEKCEKLPELRWLPWSENEVLQVLKGNMTQHMSGHITVEMMQRLSYLLQRPLVRISKEAMKLSNRLNICSKHEIEAAFRCVLSRSVAHSCYLACSKALTLFSLSGDASRQSKGARCGLQFSVGKFHRWMLHARISDVVHEFAAIALASCMENLLEEIVLRCLNGQELGENVWNLNVLEYGITHNAELWGLLQPYEHLVCGRDALGIATLPVDFVKAEGCSRDRTYEQETLEECMLATCFGSVQELGDLVYELMLGWYQSPCPVAPRSQPAVVCWSPEALSALYAFTKCQDSQSCGGRGDDSRKRKFIPLTNTRTYNLMPPLHCWVGCTLAFTEHRGCCVVSADDVIRAVSVLLPASLRLAVHHTPSPDCTAAPPLSAAELQLEAQRELLFRAAMTRQHSLLRAVLSEANDRELVNTPNQQGLTPLMRAVQRGSEEAVLCLLNHAAAVNAKISPADSSTTLVHPASRGWSALHLAVLYRHPRLAQHLLDRGAQVDGKVRADEDHSALTPLQLACAAGNLELVSLLLKRGANPYVNTTPRNSVSFTYNRGGLTAFSMAAMHGHREVLRYLVNNAPAVSEGVMSLAEALQEHTLTDNIYLPKSKYHIYEEIPDMVYHTINDSTQNKKRQHSPKRQSAVGNVSARDIGRNNNSDMLGSEVTHNSASQLPCSNGAALSKAQLLILQDALYNAAECGCLEVASDLHRQGVPWTLFTWGRSLEYAFELGKSKYLESLLQDFHSMFSPDDVTVEFVNNVLPLLFDMLKLNKDTTLKPLISSVLMALQGKEPLPKLKAVHDSFYSIDPAFLNNRSNADVQLLVEGQSVFAHRAVLTCASPRFLKLLNNCAPATMAAVGEHHVNVLQLNDLRYTTLQYMLRYLYHGSAQNLTVDSKDIFELFAAARYYKLEGLKRHCEALAINKMHLDNAPMVYRNAKIHQAHALADYCDGFFLQNLAHLLTHNESFHKMVYSRKRQGYNVLGGMLQSLTNKLNAKLETKRKLAPSVRL